MRIIHTADLHLDSALTTRLSADRVQERKRELLASFRNNIIEAEKLGAAAFIIAGDLFDSEKATASSVRMLFEIIESKPNMIFFYLYGNHEGRLIVDSGAKLPENLKLFGDGWTYFRIGDVTITGRCETARDMFQTLTLDEGKANIVVLHGELCDRSDEGGKIGIKEMENLPIDYLALGHYHNYKETKITQRTTAVYSGTPEGRGFDEVGDKGIVLLETTPYGIRNEFIKTAKRTLHIVKADITNAMRGIDIEDAVEWAIRGCSREDIVRVLLTGERALSDRIDSETVIEELNKRFTGRFYYIEFKDELKTKISAEEFKNDRSLKGEFIRSVIADESLGEDKKEKIIRLGLKALLGESID